MQAGKARGLILVDRSGHSVTFDVARVRLVYEYAVLRQP